MVLVKKLDRYILQKFLLVFAGAFFICLFVFMMQFTWRYVDELIGKGLSLDILAQFFWYMGLTLVPQALPLAVLLASLITFGNLGESLELLAIKAAGVPLRRVMLPLAVFATLLGGISFHFQNSISPEAQINLRTLLFSMKQQSPAVEIPEGVFYNEIPNINLFVQHKNTETGMLYQTIIYKTDQGFDRAQIVLADSARLEVTEDKMHMKLDLWSGEQFESFQSASGSQAMRIKMDQPFDRETFQYKQLLIDFDTNFNLMDKEMLNGMPSAKDMRQIAHSVDSMNHELDSIGKAYYKEASLSYFRRPKVSAQDSVKLAGMLQARRQELSFDRIVETASAEKLLQARQSALATVRSMSSDLDRKSMSTSETERNIRKHWVEWHQKITLSLACIIFFFVGAPLGAIIRKGGLGMPTVISVIIFIFWYIINTSGMKMARDGSINMAFGMWISTIVIAPYGFLIAYKANKDSVVFNLDTYVSFFRRMLGLRTNRHIAGKEVIIENPRLDVMEEELKKLRLACLAYNEEKKLLHAPSYARIFFRHTPDTQAEKINGQMERIVEELSNSRDPKVIGALNRFPVIFTHAHTSPFQSHWMNVAAGVVFPVGCVLWFRMWRFRLRLHRDISQIVSTCDRLSALIAGRAVADDEQGDSRHQGTILAARLHKWKKWIIAIIFALVLVIIAWSAGSNLSSKSRPDTAGDTKTGQTAPAAAPRTQDLQPGRLNQPPRKLQLPAKAP